VNFQVAGHQTEGYLVSTPVYEGPLDLLLELIQRAELDITRLALAQVTDQYLAYLNTLQDRSAAEVSAFLVIAARLVQIKSSALLPRPTIETNFPVEEDPGEALVQQLILYKRFKELAAGLDERQIAGLRTYLRVAAPTPRTQPLALDLNSLSLSELVQAAKDIFSSKPSLPTLNQVVNMPRITIRDKIRTLLEQLRHTQRLTFQSLLSDQAQRVEIVVTFLAMLELIKRRIVIAQQSGLFSSIEIETQGEWNEQQESLVIEFDE
jgi:segregation and condensation protein A